MEKGLRKYFGDRKFYTNAIRLMLPIMIQNGITNFVSMLDNIMVGRVGNVEMTGVAVANQLLFVFNLCIFGAVSGAGIFIAQFFGKNDSNGAKYTFRYKLALGIVLSLAGILVLLLFDDFFINAYLKGEGNQTDIEASFKFGKEYINVMLIGLVPYALVQCFSSTLRETGKTVEPMISGIIAVAVNLILNWFLIFGSLGAPRLGVKGAAIATVISRFAELAAIVFFTWRLRRRNGFMIQAFKGVHIPLKLAGQITVKGMPLMVNEALWATGTALLNQCYSERGFNVVSANNICQTFFNVFSVAFMAVGVAIGIIVGQLLGAGKNEEARSSARKLIVFSIGVSLAVGAAFFIAAEFIPHMYNTTDEIRLLATRLMQVSALAMPLDAYANASYFTLRSGGKVIITMLFDCCFVWIIAVPTAYILSRYTTVPIVALYAVCQAENFIKDILGYVFVKSGTWVKNIVD